MAAAQNEEYRQMYWNLFDLLQKAYMDRYLLEELSKYNEEIKQHENAYKTYSYSVIGHLFILLKNDLCLTLWKIYFDNDGDALTISKLNQHLRQITGENYESKISKHLRIYDKAIDTVRDQYLAHNDKEKENVRVKLSDLYAIMDEICILLNGMCKRDVDSGVMLFSENTKKALKKRCTQGLANMIYHNDQPIAIRIPHQDE